MQRIVVLGAGDLGATIARRLAEKEMARRVQLLDPDEGRARGKALDILQSGPVEGYDTRVEGGPYALAAGEMDVLVVADAPEVAAGAKQAGEWLGAILESAQPGIVVLAVDRPAPLVEASSLPRARILGSAPIAVAAALRRRLADALEIGAREVSVALLGLPPDLLIVPQGTATAGGVSVEKIQPVALRQALRSVTGRTLGPVALAAAAVRLLGALAGSRTTVLPMLVRLEGEYGHRGVALAAPARIARGGLLSVVEIPLEPVDRVALDNAAERRFSAAAREGRKS